MDNQYSYYNPNETEGNTSNGTTFYNNGQGDDGKTPKKKKEHKKMPKAVAVTCSELYQVLHSLLLIMWERKY